MFTPAQMQEKLDAMKADPKYKCLENFFVFVIEFAALAVLKGLLETLRNLIVGYLSYLMLDVIDRELEKYLNMLWMEPYNQFVSSINNLLNSLWGLLPPAELQDCVGAGEVMDKLYGGLSRLQVIFGFLNEFTTRMAISQNIEEWNYEMLQSVIMYIDLMIYYIEYAITIRTQQGET